MQGMPDLDLGILGISCVTHNERTRNAWFADISYLANMLGLVDLGLEQRNKGGKEEEGGEEEEEEEEEAEEEEKGVVEEEEEEGRGE